MCARSWQYIPLLDCGLHLPTSSRKPDESTKRKMSSLSNLEGALLVLHEMAKKNDAPLIPDSLNINTDYWADVRVIELGCQ
jgi:hypothetical protein